MKEFVRRYALVLGVVLTVANVAISVMLPKYHLQVWNQAVLVRFNPRTGAAWVTRIGETPIHWTPVDEHPPFDPTKPFEDVPSTGR